MKGETPRSLSALRPGAVLDRYELQSAVAVGGMGTVWRARLLGKHGFEKIVAVKTMRAELAADDRFRRMFLDEARIASRVQHQNVASILELGEHDDNLYLVMEWVDGASLEEVATSREGVGIRLPVGIALRVVADAALGLHAAHELRDERGESLHLVHRDVSPHNLMITERGVTKVVDFGIAKARGRLADETGLGRPKGKAAYMAPEQAGGRPVDRRADVWGLGSVLFRILAGHAPFLALDELEDYLAGKAGLLHVPTDVPDAVGAVVARALAPEPGRRYRTAAELHAACEAGFGAVGGQTTTLDVAAYLAARLGKPDTLRPEPEEATKTTQEVRRRPETGGARSRVLLVDERGPGRLGIRRALVDGGFLVTENSRDELLQASTETSDYDFVLVHVDPESTKDDEFVDRLRARAKRRGHPCRFVAYGSRAPGRQESRPDVRTCWGRLESLPALLAQLVAELDEMASLGEGIRRVRIVD